MVKNCVLKAIKYVVAYTAFMQYKYLYIINDYNFMHYKNLIALSIVFIMIVSTLGLFTYNNDNTDSSSNFPVNSVYVMGNSEVSFLWNVYI